MSAQVTPRWIELDGLVNLRDIGGLPTTDGGTTLPGRVLRSDNLQELPEATVRHLVNELGVTDVIDLRTHVEVAKEGDGPMTREAGVRIHHLTLYPEDTAETGIPAGERELPWAKREAEDRAARAEVRRQERLAAQEVQRREAPGHEEYWSAHYLGYLVKRPENVVAAMQRIAHARGAALVHCAAGKDRTGTIIAMTLSLVGATPEAIRMDYAASAERVPRILERLRARPAYAANMRAKTVAEQSPRAETMTLMLEAVQVQFGGVEAWLADHGWSDEDTAALRRKLRG